MQSLLCLALSNAILATMLAALVAVLSRFCRRPAVRHALWLLVLLKLITPPLVPIAVTWPQSEVSEPQATEPPPSAFVLPVVSEQREATAADSETYLTGTQREQAMDSPLLVLRAGEVLLGIWLSGALLWWTVVALRLRRFRRLLRLAQPAAADVQEQGRRLAALLGLRRCPPIVFVSAPLSPMLWALGFEPRLLVPAELWSRLTEEQQDTLLAHELAHLRRGDHWVRRLELLVLGLYWWNPVVWWAQRRLQEAEEECCDTLVVTVLPDAAPSYASALVETVAFLSQTRPAALVGASGVGHVPLLKRRLTMILTEPSRHNPSRLGFWIVLGMGALLLPLAPEAAWTEPPKELQGEKPASPPIRLDLGFPIADRVAKSVPVVDEMRACLSCHQAPVPGNDFHGKPQSWQHAHDEIVRLMDELKRLQAEFRGAANRLPAAGEPDRPSVPLGFRTMHNIHNEIEKLQDEIELLKIQVRIKQAHVSATKATLSEHKRRYQSYLESNRNQPGSIPADKTQEVRLTVTTQEAQLQINEAELEESQIRLKQAERRLARVQPPKPPATVAKPNSPERLKELEKKLDELRKEMDKLRREMQPDKPGMPRKPSSNNPGQGDSAQRQKRQLRWSMRFENENATEYVAQLRGLNAILAIPSNEKDGDPKFKIIRDLSSHPPVLSDDKSNIGSSHSDYIRWVDDDPKSAARVMSALGLSLRPSHFIVFLPKGMEQKLFRLEKNYLEKHHTGRTEDEIVETTFRIKRYGSTFEPAVVGQKIR
jgi:bla regulator protein blaR1